MCCRRARPPALAVARDAAWRAFSADGALQHSHPPAPRPQSAWRDGCSAPPRRRPRPQGHHAHARQTVYAEGGLAILPSGRQRRLVPLMSLPLVCHLCRGLGPKSGRVFWTDWAGVLADWVAPHNRHNRLWLCARAWPSHPRQGWCRRRFLPFPRPFGPLSIARGVLTPSFAGASPTASGRAPPSPALQVPRRCCGSAASRPLGRVGAMGARDGCFGSGCFLFFLFRRNTFVYQRVWVFLVMWCYWRC